MLTALLDWVVEWGEAFNIYLPERKRVKDRQRDRQGRNGWT